MPALEWKLLWSKPMLYLYAAILLYFAYATWHHHVYQQGVDATDAAWQKKEADAVIARAKKSAQASKEHQAEVAHIKEVFDGLQARIDLYENPNTVCFDARAISLWNDAASPAGM